MEKKPTMKRRSIAIVLFIAIVLSITISAHAKSKKITKPKTVSAKSISFVEVSDDWKECTFKWKKVKGAKGYQVRIIDYIAFSRKKIKTYNKGLTTKNSIAIVCPNKAHCENGYLVQVRAYKVKKSGAKLYGKWSTSQRGFGTYIY